VWARRSDAAGNCCWLDDGSSRLLRAPPTAEPEQSEARYDQTRNARADDGSGHGGYPRTDKTRAAGTAAAAHVGADIGDEVVGHAGIVRDSAGDETGRAKASCSERENQVLADLIIRPDKVRAVLLRAHAIGVEARQRRADDWRPIGRRREPANRWRTDTRGECPSEADQPGRCPSVWRDMGIDGHLARDSVGHRDSPEVIPRLRRASRRGVAVGECEGDHVGARIRGNDRERRSENEPFHSSYLFVVADKANRRNRANGVSCPSPCSKGPQTRTWARLRNRR